MHNNNDLYATLEYMANTGKRITSHSIVRKVTAWLADYYGNTMLTKFGKEYMISEYTGYSKRIKHLIIHKFVRKYDKNFRKHVSTSGDKNTPSIINKLFLVPLNRKDTFMYISTGKYSSTAEDRFATGRTAEKDDMYIYIFGKKMREYTRELDSIIDEEFVENTTDLGIYNIDKSEENPDEHEKESLSIRYIPIEPRGVDTLFYSFNELNRMIAHIDHFIVQRDIYKKHQLPYKTGILLYGKPGTGKTTCIRALATLYNRDIVNINIAHLMSIDLARLSEAIVLDEEKEYIVVMEDIDCLALNREGTDKITRDDQATLNKLLGFLDGGTSPSNVIFIATTNHKERLDEALTRHGRFDVHIEVQELLAADVMQFGQSFGLSKDKCNEVMSEYVTWANSTGKIIETDLDGNRLFNQSAIQGLILNKVEDKLREVSVVDTSEELAKAVMEESKQSLVAADTPND